MIGKSVKVGGDGLIEFVHDRGKKKKNMFTMSKIERKT